MESPGNISKKILKYLNFDRGFYIECGANDGVRQSNTLKLQESRNWEGILIEPSLNAYNLCCKNRQNNIIINCALVSFDFPNNEICGDFDGNLMSSINGRRKNIKGSTFVKARTLQSVLDEHDIKSVDFFSLDVEGYELDVLKGTDFDKTNIDWILIEIYNKDYEEICKFLSDNNYELIENISGFNKIDYPNWDGSHNDYLFKRK